MTLQNVTVIIPAHNRPERLRRLLDYYSRTDIKILVPDSSDHPFADAEKYPDITYLHRPKLHFLLKLKEVLPMISTSCSRLPALPGYSVCNLLPGYSNSCGSLPVYDS